jgi:hypothetical protein
MQNMSRLPREKLAAEMYRAYWRDLSAHALRDAVFAVSPTVELLDVGEAIATNQTGRVQNWLAQGALTRPGREQLQVWKPGKVFGCLIVQPYVLIQETDQPDEEVGPADEMTWEDLIQFLRRR